MTDDRHQTTLSSDVYERLGWHHPCEANSIPKKRIFVILVESGDCAEDYGVYIAGVFTEASEAQTTCSGKLGASIIAIPVNEVGRYWPQYPGHGIHND